MRQIFSVSTALLLAGTMLSGAACAQTAVTPRQEQAGLPAGPYLLSCTNPHTVNGRLVALCDNRTNAAQGEDAWHRAQLSNAQQCNGAVENRDGQLTCGTMPMAGSSTPPQSYGSAFGTAGSSYGSPSATMGPASGPSMPPYQASPSASANIGHPYPGYGSWQQPVYRPTTSPQYYDYGSPSASTNIGHPYPGYGSWQTPVYHPATPPAR